MGETVGEKKTKNRPSDKWKEMLIFGDQPRAAVSADDGQNEAEKRPDKKRPQELTRLS